MRFSALVIALLASGCVPEDQPRDLFVEGRVKVHVDRLTGCQYLVVLDRMITPRLGPDGLPLCLLSDAPTPPRKRGETVA